MDNLLEILVPLIFAAIYFFGNMFGKSKDEDSAPPVYRRGSDEEDSDAAERQRRIQEEIRRKIMERRRAAAGDQAQAAPADQQLRERREATVARREVRHAQKETREVVHERREAQRTPEPKSSEAGATFSWDESDNAYEDTLQAQLKQIEATKRRAEKLKKEAAEKRQAIEGTTVTKQRSGAYFSGSVRENLQNPQAARAAFIYGEVLGQPTSLRKGQSVPGLN